MNYAFPPPPIPSLPIAGSDAFFPVRRIYCVGRNYVAHAREMGADEREPPFFFTKFPDTIVSGNATIPYPPATADFQYEGELVIAIGADVQSTDSGAAATLVFGYAAGLDMTRRDLQFEARDKGRPWDMGKNFSHAAPIGPIHRADEIGTLSNGLLTLTVNGEVRQQQDVSELIWNCEEIITHLGRFDRLAPGDLIFTGTPAGVGAVRPGDRIRVEIPKLTPLEVVVGS